MIWQGLLLLLGGQIWIPTYHTMAITHLTLGSGKQDSIQQMISNDSLKVPETAIESPSGHPKRESDISGNETRVPDGSQGNMEENKNHNDPKTTTLPTAAQPTSAADDNFSYIFSRLSAMDAAIHRLNVQFHGMDVKFSQLSQSVAKLRTKLDDNQDAITSLSKMNVRNMKQIGQLEGCMKGRRFTRKCYLLFLQFESYPTAQQLCQSKGGNLAMPTDQQEYAALAQYIHDALFPSNWPVWIGINDQRSEGMYLYESGHRVSFFNWYKDHMVTQPNGGTVENCISVSSDDGKWWDNDCTRRMYYICEY